MILKVCIGINVSKAMIISKTGVCRSFDYPGECFFLYFNREFPEKIDLVLPFCNKPGDYGFNYRHWYCFNPLSGR